MLSSLLVMMPQSPSSAHHLHHQHICFAVAVGRQGCWLMAPHLPGHRPAWNAVQLTLKMGKPFLSVEDVLRSRTHTANGSTSGASFRDIVFGNGLAGESMLFHWQVGGKAVQSCRAVVMPVATYRARQVYRTFRCEARRGSCCNRRQGQPSIGCRNCIVATL